MFNQNSKKNSHLFSEGQEVYAKIDPDQKLVVRRYLDRIYYCRVLDKPDHKDLVYFEREIEACPIT